MTKHWLHYQARSAYQKWGRAAGFVLGIWLALVRLVPMVVREPAQSVENRSAPLPQVGAGTPGAVGPAPGPSHTAR